MHRTAPALIKESIFNLDGFLIDNEHLCFSSQERVPENIGGSADRKSLLGELSRSLELDVMISGR